MAAGPELRIQVLPGVTAAEVAPVGKGLAVLDHDQVDVDSVLCGWMCTSRPRGRRCIR
jgi:hypothetical protein